MSFKKLLLAVLPFLLVYAWYFFAYSNQHPKTLIVLGANTNAVLYEEPQAGHDPIINAINSAKKEVLVEVYLLSDKQILSALENAKSHGVDVKVMLEEHPFGSPSFNKKSKNELDSAGVQTRWSNPSFSLTHEKAIIIDSSAVFVLSQNLTASAFSKNREHDVLDTNPGDVIEARNIFVSDWERKSYSPPSLTNIIESPDNSRAGLETLINSAKSTIDAETENIDDTGLINLLKQKAKSAVKVRLLTPTVSQLSSNQPVLKELATNGVEVKTISSPYMHAKMIVADSTKAYTGSINFSTQSIDHNRELGIILADQTSLHTLETDFESDWQNGVSFQ